MVPAGLDGSMREGERRTKEGKGVKKKTKREVTREADKNGPFLKDQSTQRVEHVRSELKHKVFKT